MADLERLLEEFAADFEAGREPQLDALLSRAPASRRDELAELIDRYLLHAPRRRFDAAAYERSPARDSVERVWESLEGVSGSWPELLPHLRNRARIRRRDLVERLAEALGLGAHTGRIAEYYNDMEHGRLPAAGVSGRVIEALAAIVSADPETIRAAGRATTPPPDAAPLFARQALIDESYGPAAVSEALAERVVEPQEPDEVDRLFRGGPD